MADVLRSKYVFIKTILDPGRELAAELSKHHVDWSMVWAYHDNHDTPHYHAVIRFASTEVWQWLRNWLMQPDHDPHSYSAPGRGWQRCVRYLLHLDSPDKLPIPRKNLSFTGAISGDEISMLLGRPRASLLADIRNCPKRDTFALVDWLVNEKGHTPGEVAQMLRCITAVNSYLGPLSLLARPQDIPPSFGSSEIAESPDSSDPDDPAICDSDLPSDLGCLPDDLD